MHLINELAYRWGSRATPEGKLVWLELEIPMVPGPAMSGRPLGSGTGEGAP
jgi:hypothetical protein